MSQSPPIAMAIAAHPDDIEFLMAGTLHLLARAGWETHYMTVANGSCGSLSESSAAIARRRGREARAAARILGATYHPPLTDDATILYEMRLLRRLAARVREVGPRVLLVPSPQDYMEDHTETCRLAVTAAFVRGMPNFRTTPARRPRAGDVTIYHAMPHGLVDPLRRRVLPGAFVDTASVHAVKREALMAHRSQLGFLADTQHMSSYVQAMEDMSRAVGRMSKRFTHAEGWRRHLHFGFCAPDDDPLRDVLGRGYVVNARYERELRAPLGGR
jgi:N-acetylglucosamine malate deacetylase 1